MPDYHWNGEHSDRPDSFDAVLMPRVRYKKEPPPPKPPRELMPCGTRPAARRHERRGEKLRDCPPCYEANRAYKAELRERRKAA